MRWQKNDDVMPMVWWRWHDVATLPLCSGDGAMKWLCDAAIEWWRRCGNAMTMLWWYDDNESMFYRPMVPSILQMCCLQEYGVRFEYSSDTLTETNEFACFFYSRMFGFLIYYCKIIENVSNAFFSVSL